MSLILFILIGGFVFFVVRFVLRAMRRAARYQKLDEHMRLTTFSIDELLMGQDAWSALATNRKNSEFLLAQINAADKVRLQRADAADILAVALIENGVTLQEVQRGKGEVHKGLFRIQKPLTPQQQRAAKWMGKSPAEFAELMASKSEEVHAIDLAIVLNERGKGSFEDPWIVDILSSAELNSNVQRGSKQHAQHLKIGRTWLHAFEGAMQATSVSSSPTKTKTRASENHAEHHAPSRTKDDPPTERQSFRELVAAGRDTRTPSADAVADEAPSAAPAPDAEQKISARAADDARQRMKDKLQRAQQAAEDTSQETAADTAHVQEALRKVRERVETSSTSQAPASSVPQTSAQRPQPDDSFESLWEEQRRKAFAYQEDAS